MPTCPAGHQSADAQYCEVCGIRMPQSSLSVVPGSGADTSCPECGEVLIDRFCEGCGYDTMNPQRSQSGRQPYPDMSIQTGWTGGGGWMAVVRADRDYYERLMAGADPDDIPFPPYHPERQYPLTGQYVRIGRRSLGRGVLPEIDLSLPPEDPAVSHEHAVLLGKPDNSWVLIDLGATNGTLVNDTIEPVRSHVEIPLSDGDRIYVGAWTVIAVRKG